MSVVEKAKKEGLTEFNFSPSEGYAVSNLERILYRFPEVVERAGADLSPSTIANFLIELAANFNAFYASGQIIDMGDANTSLYKVALAEAFAATMKNGLYLLGIDVPERM